MTGKTNTTNAVLDRLTDALVEDILNASDEEILAEFREAIGDPERHAADMRERFETCLIAAKKERLKAAKVGVAATRRALGKPAPVIDIEVARARIRDLLESNGLTKKLTLAARKESELSDADIVSMFDDLRQLGVLPSEDDEGGSG